MGKAKSKLKAMTKEFHATRRQRLEEEIEKRTMQRFSLYSTNPPCEKHDEYTGITNRSKSKCEGCRSVYEGGAYAREEHKRIGKIISKGKQILKQIGDEFLSTSDAHWRELLFNTTIGCGLRPTGRTKIKKAPSVKDEAIERLQKRYPDNAYLSLRVDIQATKTRLSTRLSVEPEDDGCVHFPYHSHRSGPGRISSGKDDEESTKVRTAPGNAQNITHRDRAIYCAPDGQVFIGCDSSQIEARVMATHANELRMLRAWEQGLDIHAINGASLARALGCQCAAEEADRKTFRFAGEVRTYRYAAKRMTHGWNYGMLADLTAELFGITKAVAQRLIDAYFETWPRIREFQQELVARAARDHYLVNSFGRVFPFWSFKRDREGRWTLADPNEAISFPAQSDVSDMCKAILPKLDEVAMRWGGSIRHTEHDSFLALMPDDPAVVKGYIEEARPVMEREWPQLPVRLGKVFTCPAEFKVGRRWADYSDSNPDGLRKVA